MFTVGKTIIYTFLATKDVLPGTLGRIETQKTICKTTFTTHRFFFLNRKDIAIDENTGLITLKRKFDLRNSKIEKLTAKVQLTTKCGYLVKFKYDVIVNLVVLPLNCGDSFLKSYFHKLNNMVTENKKFNIQKGLANSLHRIMRMVSKDKNPETFDEMMASAKVDTALEGAINDIVETFAKKCSGEHFI